jgi:hypothetical protein
VDPDPDRSLADHQDAADPDLTGEPHRPDNPDHGTRCVEPGATDASVGTRPYSPNQIHDQERRPADRGATPVTPVKGPGWEKEFNTAINRIRYLVERTIANLKTWRILHTDYRRPLATFITTISTVIGLHFYAMSCE